MSSRKHPLLALTTAFSAVLLMVGLAGPATAETAEPVDPIDVSYLFTIDSATIRVIPSRGDFGRAIVTLPATFTRFTDRPARDTERITAPELLRDFGWTPSTHRLRQKFPNAAIAIGGDPSQVVELRTARVFDDRIVFRVKALDAPLERRRGPGSVFIDDADPSKSNTITTTFATPRGLPPLTFTSTFAPGNDTTVGPSVAVTISLGALIIAQPTLTVESSALRYTQVYSPSSPTSCGARFEILVTADLFGPTVTAEASIVSMGIGDTCSFQQTGSIPIGQWANDPQGASGAAD